MPFPPIEDQLAVIRRGVEKIVPEEELAEKLKQSRESGQPLRIKYGIDPTAADVHLGHTVPLRKMRQFQELGHQAVIIIGNYTAMVGDPSGRDEARTKKLSEVDVEANAQFYLSQVGKVIDIDQAEVHRNGDWFGGMSFADILNLCGKVTVAQLLTRDDFSKRMKAETPIYLHECLYPIMQAWDSVQIKADIELGGTEQLYSFMLARDLQKDAQMSQQIGVMSPILVGTDGKKRMGKSLGNYIGISEEPYEMMKKFMRIPDSKEQDDGMTLQVMRMFYELLTDRPLVEVDVAIKDDPKGAKIDLAKRVIAQYHDSNAANAAEVQWNQEIKDRETPSDIPTRDIFPEGFLEGVTTFSKRDATGNPKEQAYRLFHLAGLCNSKSEARNLIKGGGAYFGEHKQRIATFDQEISITTNLLLWAGKQKVIRVSPGPGT